MNLYESLKLSLTLIFIISTSYSFSLVSAADNITLNNSSLLFNDGEINETPPISTLQDELQCYALPYGALGFVSHILTYYTITLLALQRPPWAPWRKQLHHATIDYLLAAVTLIATITITIITMVRCRNRWQFIAM